MNTKAIFIVGLGAPASLYNDYLDNLREYLGEMELLVLEWWNQEDFGLNSLQSFIGDSPAFLIGHSAGSVIALQAFANFPDLVKKIIMLDSHFLHSKKTLGSVNAMLDKMLRNDDSTIAKRVREAYAPIVKDNDNFNKALEFALEWVNSSFDQVCTLFKEMPEHSGLQMVFTNSKYQMPSAEEELAICDLWEKSKVDVKFLPMNHFDLIDEKHAANINLVIADWLETIY